MTQNDGSGDAPGDGDRGEAPTQALPPFGTGEMTRGAGSPFGRSSSPRPGRGRSSTSDAAVDPGTAGLGLTGADRRPSVGRPSVNRVEGRGGAGRPPVRARRAKLALKRIDPWSVFLFSLLASIFLGIVLVVAVAVLYAVLANLGVLDSINDLFGEVAGDGTEGAAAGADDLITSGRVLSGAAVLAAVDIVLLTALATLGALLYNLCAALTGGIEVTLGERD